MKLTDKITAVGQMQKYIATNLSDVITLDDLSLAAGYSKFHAARMFKELSGKSPHEYIRAMRLTSAARDLRDNGGKIVDIALESGYDSHDGFTRAFAKQFGITPKKYAEEKPPVPYFTASTVSAYYSLKSEENNMHNTKNEKVPTTVTVTAVERPARKLILLRAKNTTGGDYFAFCEEMTCDWEGMLGSIPEKLTSAALLTLPQNLVKPGTSDTAAGVEVPADYKKPVPDGYDIIDLPPCTMLFFQGSTYENEDDFCIAIGIVWGAVDNYDPTRYGYALAPELAPRFNFGADAKMGALQAIPVKII